MQELRLDETNERDPCLLPISYIDHSRRAARSQRFDLLR